MKTTTITRHQGSGTWNAPDGTLFYCWEVEMANGVIGQAMTKTNPAWFTDGSEVAYEITGQSAKGSRLKIRKPEQVTYAGQPQQGIKAANDARQKEIKSQWALNLASQILGPVPDLGTGLQEAAHVKRLGRLGMWLLLEQSKLVEFQDNPSEPTP